MAASAHRWQRRDLLRMGALAAGCGLLPACSPGPPLQVMAHAWPGYEFMFLAEQLGWLADSGVQLQRSAGFAESVAALREGRVQAAALTLDEVLRLREAGVAVSVVMIFNVSAGADGVLARPGIGTLQELRGKRIAVEDNSLGAVMLAKTLQAAGLRRDEVEVVSFSGDHLQAWQEQQPLDALITYEPTLGRLQAQGLSNLFDSRQLPQLILDVLAVRSDDLAGQESALRALLAAHFRAQREWLTNPIDTAYRLAPLLGVAPDDVATSFRGIDLPDALYNREYLTAPASTLGRAARELAEVMVQSGQLRFQPDLRELFLADYLPDVRA